jgi:parallel beta-helix repeat protein
MPSRQLCLLLCASLTKAASYHFAADGNDTRTPAQAVSDATPWKSLSKLAFVTLQPGDSILLRKGDVWREALSIQQSGTLSRPIVLTSYGSGTVLPELRGTIELQGVTDGSLWSTAVPSKQNVGSVFVDGKPLPISRFPDTGWITAASVTGLASLSAPALAAKDWTGASIHLRTAMWTLETNRIGQQSGSQITFAKNSIYTPPAKVGFFLTNHAYALGNAPAWAFAQSTATLRWNGTSGKVEAAVLPTLLDLRGSSHIRIEGIRFFGAQTQAILADATGLEIHHCEILYPGMFGVYMASGREAEISNSTMIGAGNDALFLNGPKSVVQNNHIFRSAVTPFLTPNGMGDGCCGGYGILAQGDSSHVAGNIIDSTGYNGVGFFGISSVVEENDIGHSCMVTDDCAGIYTINGEYAKPGASRSIVRRNVVHDVVGALGGWGDAVAASQGIYLDDGSHDIRVDSNVVSGATNGLYLHNGLRDTIRDNIFYGNRVSPILMAHDGLAGAGDMKDNLFAGNLMVGLIGQGAHSDATIQQTQALPLATFHSNTTCLDHLLHVECRYDDKLSWERFGYDTTKASFGPEAPGSASFDTTVWGWGAYPWQTEFTRDSGAACAKGSGCMKVSTDKVTESNAMVYGGVVAVQQGKLYRLSFRARGNHPGQRMTPTLRHARGSWSAMGYASGLMLDTAWSRYELYMRADVTEDTARVDFTSRSLDSLWWLDDVSFRSVPETFVQGLTASHLFANPTEVTTSTSLTGTWMDATENALGTSVPLASWQGVVAFPFQGKAATGLTNMATPAFRALRFGRTWTLTNLKGPARIVGADGSIIALLTPNADGRADWVAATGNHLCFLHANGRSQTLVTP